jgi:hypothetical protein
MHIAILTVDGLPARALAVGLAGRPAGVRDAAGAIRHLAPGVAAGRAA